MSKGQMSKAGGRPSGGVARAPQKSPLPASKGQLARPDLRAPHSKGEVARSSQGGKTSPVTDGGGGVGNSAADLQRMIGRK